MRANQEEGQLFSDSIDQINNGIETIINLYNDLELDQPFIQFEPDVLERIGKVKAKYGEAFVDKKINAVVKEMIDWLPLDEAQEEETSESANPRKKSEDTGKTEGTGKTEVAGKSGAAGTLEAGGKPKAGSKPKASGKSEGPIDPEAAKKGEE